MVCDMRRLNNKDREIGRNYTVLADGKYVTQHTFYVDGRRKVLGVFAVNEAGNYFIDASGEVVREWLNPRRLRLVKKHA